MIQTLKTCLLIDTDKPDDSNINKNETAKLSNYKDLEISRLWKVRTKTVSVTLEVLGTIKKGLDQNLQLLTGHLLTIGVQKITQILHTSFVRCWGKLL